MRGGSERELTAGRKDDNPFWRSNKGWIRSRADEQKKQKEGRNWNWERSSLVVLVCGGVSEHLWFLCFVFIYPDFLFFPVSLCGPLVCGAGLSHFHTPFRGLTGVHCGLTRRSWFRVEGVLRLLAKRCHWDWHVERYLYYLSFSLYFYNNRTHEIQNQLFWTYTRLKWSPVCLCYFI